MKKTLTFTFADKQYPINFPNNRQYVLIQNLKSTLASNYDTLDFNGVESQLAKQLVDVEAHLTILCPDFIKSLTKPFGELSFIEGREISTAYVEQFSPWWTECLNFIFKANKPEEETTTTTTVG